MLSVRRLARGRGRAGGDDGSLVVAMGVMMVLTFLSIAVLARSLASLSNVRRVEADESVLATAESGLSDALFAIDQDGADLAPLAGTGTGFTWEANPDAGGYAVRVEATAMGSATAVSARVERSTEGRWPFTLFSQQDLVLDDGAEYHPPLVALDGRIGSNRSVTVRGAPAAGTAQWFYTPSGSCTGCPAGEQRSGPRLMADPARPAGAAACPVDGSGRVVAFLAGGTYACDGDIVFDGLVTVTGSADDPAVIWLGAGADVDLHDGIVNWGGDARALVLLKAGGGVVCSGDLDDDSIGVCNSSHATAAQFTGVVYAPSADLKVQGQAVAVRGSVNVNAVAVAYDDPDDPDAGDPTTFAASYDADLADVPALDWQVCAWERHPVGAPTQGLTC